MYICTLLAFVFLDIYILNHFPCRVLSQIVGHSSGKSKLTKDTASDTSDCDTFNLAWCREPPATVCVSCICKKPEKLWLVLPAALCLFLPKYPCSCQASINTCVSGHNYLASLRSHRPQMGLNTPPEDASRWCIFSNLLWKNHPVSLCYLTQFSTVCLCVCINVPWEWREASQAAA